MRAKYISVIVLGLLIGLVLLNQRHRRVDAMHDMMKMHRDMNRTRQAIWAHQAAIADRIHPAELEKAVERAGLKLEPITPASAAFEHVTRRRELEAIE